MTISEITRMAKSKQRTTITASKERAMFDYLLADLIGKSVSRIYSNSARMPELYEVYPSLFEQEDIEEKKQEQRDNLSALRFKQFAQSYNKRFKKEEAKS